MDEQAVDTALGKVRIRTGGSGDAVMFWPSLLMTGDMWSAAAVHFSATRRVIVVDPPGHGGSEKLTAPFTFERCARVIVDILDKLGLEHTHFVGNSWGGMIGGTFAATYPERIGRAVLMNCTGSAAGVRQKIEYGFLLRAGRLLGAVRPPLTRSILKAFLGPTTFRTRPDVVAFVRDTVQAVDIGSSLWAVKSIVPRRPDQRELLSRITTPVLVVAGAEDATFPLAETTAMADAIPGADLVVVDGVAHLAGLENPPLINKLIEDFLFGVASNQER